MGLIKNITTRLRLGRGSDISSAGREALRRGMLRCPRCGNQQALAECKSLQMVKCPKCDFMSFVPLKVGKFWLFQPLGGGGMGSVYKAWCDEAPNQFFAVKVLARTDNPDPGFVHALLGEARVASALGQHPSIVQCVASGYEAGEYYCALEFIDGERLDDAIERLGRLSELEVLTIALHVLAAEEHIYKRGFLYRDLKPENILIEKETGRGVLLDYGLCLPLDKALHPEEEFVTGSPYYIPPERLWGTGEDASSEIYCLGMVMYYALTGHTFYDADEVDSLAKRHVSNVRISVSAKMRGVHPEIVELLTRMLKQDKAERFQTFPEVGRAIYNICQSFANANH